MLEPDPELAIEYGIFSVRQAHAAGFSRAEVERLVRSGTWLRRGRGVISVAFRSDQPLDTLVIAALRAGPKAVVGFASAAHLHGWDYYDKLPAPHLIAPSDTGQYRRRLSADVVELHGLLRVTIPLETGLDLASNAGFDEAVLALDSGMRTNRLTKQELTSYFDRSHRGRVREARRALSFADELSGSVPETEARLLFARAGLPAPTLQCLVRDGTTVVFLDFGWEEQMVGAEIDGFRYHSGDLAFQNDRTKQNWVQLDGWLILRFTVAQLRDHPEKVIAQIRRALARPRSTCTIAHRRRNRGS